MITGNTVVDNADSDDVNNADDVDIIYDIVDEPKESDTQDNVDIDKTEELIIHEPYKKYFPDTYDDVKSICGIYNFKVGEEKKIGDYKVMLNSIATSAVKVTVNGMKNTISKSDRKKFEDLSVEVLEDKFYYFEANDPSNSVGLKIGCGSSENEYDKYVGLVGEDVCDSIKNICENSVYDGCMTGYEKFKIYDEDSKSCDSEEFFQGDELTVNGVKIKLVELHKNFVTLKIDGKDIVLLEGAKDFVGKNNEKSIEISGVINYFAVDDEYNSVELEVGCSNDESFESYMYRSGKSICKSLKNSCEKNLYSKCVDDFNLDDD